MIIEYKSYGHIGIQTKNPGHNFAFPDRASFGSRNACWNLAVLDPEVDVFNWSLF